VDHGLPLVHLRAAPQSDYRTDGSKGPINSETILEIAAIQQTIAAIEAVIVDLDAELLRIVCQKLRLLEPTSIRNRQQCVLPYV
jgi:hypothetical protein